MATRRAAAKTTRVDLNSANETDLQKIPGIGRQRARQLIRNRPFSNLEEVKRVPGFNEALVADLRTAGAAVRDGAKRPSRPSPAKTQTRPKASARSRNSTSQPARRSGKTSSGRAARKSKPEMNPGRTIAALNDLIQLDFDAIRAYDRAIRMVDEDAVGTQLAAFKGDHERHVKDLSDAVRSLGGKPPAGNDVVGYLIEAFTAVGSAAGVRGALRAMQSNEMLTNDTYSRALANNFPADVRRIVERNYNDEKRHLAWINAALKRKRAA